MAPPGALTLVCFCVEGQSYGLHLARVRRVLPMLHIAPLPGAPKTVLGVFSLHGEVVPVLDMRRRIGLPVRHGAGGLLVVADTARRTVALPVDEVTGVREVPLDAVTSTGVLVVDAAPTAGIVTLADGLLYIQDLDAFLSYRDEVLLTEALGAAEQ